MILVPTLTLSVFAMVFAQPRLSERALADIAVISIPRMVKEEMYKGVRLDQAGRITRKPPRPERAILPIGKADVTIQQLSRRLEKLARELGWDWIHERT